MFKSVREKRRKTRKRGVWIFKVVKLIHPTTQVLRIFQNLFIAVEFLELHTLMITRFKRPTSLPLIIFLWNSLIIFSGVASRVIHHYSCGFLKIIIRNCRTQRHTNEICSDLYLHLYHEFILFFSLLRSIFTHKDLRYIINAQTMNNEQRPRQQWEKNE